MAIDRRSWEERIAATRSTRAPAGIPAERLRQAAVPFERLTGSEHWDTFLRYGEQLQEDSRAACDRLHEQLASPAYLTEVQVMALRHQLAILTIAIAARQEVLNLPKSIIQQVKDATSQ